MKTIAEGYEGCALWAKHKIYSVALTTQPLTTQLIHSTTTQKQQPTTQTRAQPLKAHPAIQKPVLTSKRLGQEYNYNDHVPSSHT